MLTVQPCLRLLGSCTLILEFPVRCCLLSYSLYHCRTLKNLLSNPNNIVTVAFVEGKTGFIATASFLPGDFFHLQAGGVSFIVGGSHVLGMNGRGTHTGCKLMSNSIKEASAAPE